MSTDPDTHAAILADAARLADGGNLEAAADALRSALEIDFRQEVVDVLVMLESALTGRLDPEIALAAIEELTEADVPIEVDDSAITGSAPPVDGSSAAETVPVESVVEDNKEPEKPPAAQPGGPGTFQTAPRRPAKGMSLDELKAVLARASSGLGSESETRPAPVVPTSQTAGSTAQNDAVTPMPEARADDGALDRRTSDASKVRFKGAAPPPPAHRRRAIAPVVPDSPQARPVEEDADFDLFGSAPSGGSHLDVEPEVVTEGSLADAIAASSSPGPAKSQSIETAARVEPIGAVPAPPKENTPMETKTTPEDAVLPRYRREPDPEPRDRLAVSGLATPAVGSPVIEKAAFRTGRLRPAGARERRQPVNDLLDRVRVLLGRGDLASAQQLVEEVLLTDPGHGDAQALARDIAGRLTMLRLSALEPMNRTPRQDLGAVAGAGLSPRSMFVLSMADGSSSLEDLVDLSGMSRADALEILAGLIQKGALVF